MAKSGSAKNTKNKAKHTKLMDKKKNKQRQEKMTRKERLRAIVEGTKKNNTEEE